MRDKAAISDLITRYQIAVDVHVEVYGKVPVKTVKRLKSLKHRLMKLERKDNG